MPKKKSEESTEEQAKRFEAEVQGLIDAGELDPIEADERFDALVRSMSPQKKE